MNSPRDTVHTGDGGETSLPGGARVWKDDARLEACGAVDELNATLGLLRAHMTSPIDPAAELLTHMQSELLTIGAHLVAAPTGTASAGRLPPLRTDAVRRLEEAADRMRDDLPALNSFTIPGGCSEAALCHVARTVCRRAERRCVALVRAPGGLTCLPQAIAILNRLSDYLFVLARRLNAAAGVRDATWPGGACR